MLIERDPITSHYARYLTEEGNSGHPARLVEMTQLQAKYPGYLGQVVLVHPLIFYPI